MMDELERERQMQGRIACTFAKNKKLDDEEHHDEG
jgi:hypothetical protein